MKDDPIYKEIEDIIAKAKNFTLAEGKFDLYFGNKKGDETFITDTNDFEKSLLLAKHELKILQERLNNQDYSEFKVSRLDIAVNALDDLLWSSITLRIGAIEFGGLVLRRKAKIMGKFPY